jgi:hypothetical protein
MPALPRGGKKEQAVASREIGPRAHESAQATATTTSTASAAAQGGQHGQGHNEGGQKAAAAVVVVLDDDDEEEEEGEAFNGRGGLKGQGQGDKVACMHECGECFPKGFHVSLLKSRLIDEYKMQIYLTLFLVALVSFCVMNVY